MLVSFLNPTYNSTARELGIQKTLGKGCFIEIIAKAGIPIFAITKINATGMNILCFSLVLM